jgi:hypothetical protein
MKSNLESEDFQLLLNDIIGEARSWEKLKLEFVKIFLEKNVETNMSLMLEWLSQHIFSLY